MMPKIFDTETYLLLLSARKSQQIAVVVTVVDDNTSAGLIQVWSVDSESTGSPFGNWFTGLLGTALIPFIFYLYFFLLQSQ